MAKKKYEKPELKGEKLFEASAVACCKVSSCKVQARNSQGKTSANTDTT